MEAPENAMVALRTAQGIASGWCKQPTGLFVQALKNGASGEQEAVVVAPEYPRPTRLAVEPTRGNGGFGLHQTKRARISRGRGC